MKRIVTTLALLAMSAMTASAAVLVNETFSYPNGPLTPNGGWATFSGTGTDVQVSAGRAVVNHANAPDDALAFPVQATTATTYACFDAIVTAPPTSPKAVYFFLFKDGTTTNFVSRVYVVNQPGGFTFAVSNSSTGATAGVTTWPAVLSYGTRYQIVVNYNGAAKSTTLWVNPVNELSASVTDVNATATALAVQTVGLRQSSTASTLPAAQAGLIGVDNIQVSVDNLGVGTTFEDACVTYHTVPARKTTWGAVKSIYR